MTIYDPIINELVTLLKEHGGIGLLDSAVTTAVLPVSRKLKPMVLPVLVGSLTTRIGSSLNGYLPSLPAERIFISSFASSTSYSIKPRLIRFRHPSPLHPLASH